MNNYYMNLSKMEGIEPELYKSYAFDAIRYQTEITINTEYKISIKEFKEFLIATQLLVNFQKELEEIKKGLSTLEFVGIDFSIPVIMVKYFLNHLD